MNKTLYALPILAGGLAYLTCGDWIMAAVVLAAYGLFFTLMLPKSLTAFFTIEKRRNECFQFMNGFVIALSIKQTAAGALETLMGQVQDEVRQEIIKTDTIDTFAILDNLKMWFPFPVYEMFLTIINLHASQGGSILSMAALLLADGRRQETLRYERRAIGRRKLTNFVMLWLLTIVVLLFARFGIASLFATMMNSLMFKFGLMAFYLFLLYAIYVFVSRYIGSQGGSTT